VLAIVIAFAFGQPSVSQVKTTYRYDVLGRVTSATDPAGRTVVYQYDPAGNRMSLGNGAAPGEILVSAFMASSNRGGFSGLNAAAMRDLAFNLTTSAHVTASDSLAFVQADLGAPKSIDHVDIAAPDRALAGGGVDALNGARVEYSLDTVNWTSGPLVGGALAGVYKTIALGGVQARYVRLVKSGAALGVGDFRFYSTAKEANQAPVAVDDTRTKLNKDEPVTFDPRLNDTDANRDALTITAVSPAAHGQTSFTGAGVTYTPDTGFIGDDTFTYTIADDRGGFASANIKVTYNNPTSGPGNHDPVAQDDGGPNARIFIPYAAGFETPYIRVLDNDSDPDGNTLSVVSAGPVQHGLLSIVDGVIRYFPRADQFTGFEDFPYTISDGYGGTATARVWVRIGNTYPQAVDDQASTYQNLSVVISPLANDYDVEGDPLSLLVLFQPAHGSVSQLGNDVVYTPSPGYAGPDNFTYYIADGRGGTSSAAVYVTVNAGSPNHPPLARNFFSAASRAQIIDDLPVNLYVTAGSTDPDDDPITISSFTQPAHGVVTLPSPSSPYVTYKSAAGYLGPDSFNFTISDGRGGTSTATAYLEVIHFNNSAPEARADSYTVQHDQTTWLGVRSNDFDANADDITIVAVTQPGHGSTAITSGASGTAVNYTPTAGYTGPDQFTYTIADPHGARSTATVTLTVMGNMPPVAVNDAVTGRYNEMIVLNHLLDNDSDPNGDLLNFVSVTQPSHGALRSGGSYAYLYTPTVGFVGVDTFTYTITDGWGQNATATVTITVPPDPPPVARPDSFTIDYNTSATFDVLANDSDPTNDPMSITAVGQPAHGTAVIANGKIAYTPTHGYSGADSFTYTVADDKGGATTATVSIMVVHSSNRSPSAVNDSYATPVNTANTLTPQANDTDPDGDALMVTVIGTPAHGVAVITSGGAGVRYTPQTGYLGTDSFDYTVSDGYGGQASARITVTIMPNNRPPTPLNDSAGLLVANTTATIPVLVNDTDPDGDALSIAAVGAPAHGVTTIVGNTITYAPAANYSGQDSFTYTVSDGKGGLATATVNAVVTINHPPVARDYGPVTLKNRAWLPLTSMVTDPDYDPITVTSVGVSLHGASLIKDAAGVDYTPPANYSGPDSFTYTVSDGRGGTATANVLVNASTSYAPYTGDRRVNLVQGVTSELYLDGGNPNASGWSYGVLTAPTHGTMSTIGPYGLFTYTPAYDYTGPDSLKFTISDGRGGTYSGWLYITVVQSAEHRPVVQADGPFNTAFNTPITLTTLLNNDSDPDGEPLEIVGVVQGTGGRAALVDSHTVVFIPDNNFSGSNASFSYYVTDGKSPPILGAVSITVGSGNHAPSAAADVATAVSGAATMIDVLSNDSDADGDTLSLSAVGTPGHGTAVISGTKVLYTPAAGYSGSDSFSYTVSDGKGGSTSATVTVTVT